MPAPVLPSRRAGLRLAAAAACTPFQPLAAWAAGDPPTGWVRPRPLAPELPLQCADGRSRALRTSLQGAVTAVQLMFTGCNGSCPVQGALFADIAGRLPPAGFQLLSISIDALGDNARTLRDWLARYGTVTPAGWLAGVPAVQAVDGLSGFLRGTPGSGAQGAHTAQVFVFDREARLAYRTGDNPESAWLQALMVHIARGGG